MNIFKRKASRSVPPAPGSRFDRKLIAPMILGSILNPINSSIISIALIPIGAAFHASPSDTAWLVSGLYLATAIGQPVVGRLIDLYGPRLLYLIATALVGLAGLLAVLAPSLPWLVASRVLLGFGTCAGYPASMYLIRSEADRTGEKSPAGILTLLAVSSQTIAVVGPTLGGLLIEWGGWQSAFLLNVPLSAACLALGWRRFPKRPRREASRPQAGFDLAGMALFAATLLSALLFLMAPRLQTLYAAGIAVVCGAGFAIRERRAAHPFIDIRVLGGNVPLLMTYARNLLAGTLSYSFLYGYSQWLEEGRGLSPSTAGLLLLPLFVSALAVSSATGKLPAIRPKLTIGSAALLAAFALLLLAGDRSPLMLLAGLALLMGVPQGLLNLANQNALYHQAVPEQIGASSGLLRTSAYMGAMLASAANGIFLRSGASTAGIRHLALFGLIVAVALAAMTLPDRSIVRIDRGAARQP